VTATKKIEDRDRHTPSIGEILVVKAGLDKINLAMTDPVEDAMLVASISVTIRRFRSLDRLRFLNAVEGIAKSCFDEVEQP